MLVTLYVDDIVFVYYCQRMFQSLQDKLTTKFKCKDLGELLKVLNMEILRTAY